MASPRTDWPPNESAMPFNGWPSKRSRNTADQFAAKPQFAGRSCETAMPDFAMISAQPPSEPSRGQLAPPSASISASGPIVTRSGASNTTSPRSSQPVQ